MSDPDSFMKVRADFEALKSKLKASSDDLDPEHYDRLTAKLVAHDEATIRQIIEKRRGSHRIERAMAEIERRLAAAEEREGA